MYMSRKLSEMTLEELWALFPIILEPHSDRWTGYYAEIERLLSDAFEGFDVRRISHIGSTAIDGIWAKPIVDVLVELGAGESMENVSDAIVHAGFIRMSASTERMSFNRGYTEQGFAEKVYHLHLRRAGDHDELYFRDYMNAHPDAAAEYERLKLDLRKRFEHDRDGYTAAKTDFIREYTEKAKAEFAGRYD